MVISSMKILKSKHGKAEASLEGRSYTTDLKIKFINISVPFLSQLPFFYYIH